jgi:hypothetical protein
LFTDINGADTESPTDADRRLTENNSPVYRWIWSLMFHKGFFLDAAFAYSADFYRFDFDYQGLMDIRNAEIFTVFC